MKYHLLAALIAATSVFTGCGHQENFTKLAIPAKARPILIEASSDLAVEASAPPPPGATVAAVAAQPVLELKPPMSAEDSQSILLKDESAQIELNKALAEFQKTRGVIPRDVHELVNAKLIARVPVPPQGGLYAIDVEARTIVWSRQ